MDLQNLSIKLSAKEQSLLLVLVTVPLKLRKSSHISSLVQMVHDIALALGTHITWNSLTSFKSMSDIHFGVIEKENSIGKSGERESSFTTTW